MSDQATQLSIFKIEGNTASRDMCRTLSTNLDHLRITDIGNIKIRPDQFNGRIKPEGMKEEMWEQILMIPDLAEKIYQNNGPADPILGDFHKDGNFYITNGERRYRALVHLIREGKEKYPNNKPISMVRILLNTPGTTDLERKKKMYNTNDSLPFTTMQKAHYFASFKEEPFKMSHEKIAEEFKVSRQTIDNYVLATTLPADVQDKVDSGEMKLTAALNELRQSNKKSKDDGKDIPTEAQERREKEDAAAKEKLRGDEDEFEQEDNSVNFAGSKGGFKEEGSGAHVVGKDSIYMMDQKLALWRQALNRLDVIRQNVAENLPEQIEARSIGDISPEEIAAWVEKQVATRMMNEYNLTVK